MLSQLVMQDKSFSDMNQWDSNETKHSWHKLNLLCREDPTTPEFSVSTVDEWLDSINMGQYKDNFATAGYVSLDSILYISLR